MRNSKNSSLFLLAGLLTAGLAAPALADGWYFQAGTGVNDVPQLDVSNTRGAANPAKVDMDLGMVVTGAVGYDFAPFRVEGEFGWRDNGVDKVTFPKSSGSGSGDLQPLSLMANVYYDFDTGTKWTPYLGAGAGMVDLMGKIASGGSNLTNGDQDLFAYQGIAGVAYKVNEQLSLKADYRYLGTMEASYADGPAAGGNGTAKFTYGAHAVMVGFIYRFGASPEPMPAPAPQPAAAAPAPAPAPAPEPAPAMTAAAPAPIANQFMVFFDFDKSDITSDARQILEQAVAAAKQQGTAKIGLTGHADTVGTAEYNMKLSIRRAEAVKKVLVQMGIPAGEISVVGKGKTDLLVPTPDGVREPRNRRVVIELE